MSYKYYYNQCYDELNKYKSTDLVLFLQSIKYPNRSKLKNINERIEHIIRDNLFKEFMVYAARNNFCIKKDKQTEIMKRLSTMINAARLDEANIEDKKNNIPFTQQDEEEKSKIFDIKKGYSFINKDILAKGIGDHIYGINESKDKKILGSNTKWNLLPCCHEENVSYKKINGKNMITDELSQEDISKMQLDPIKMDIYNKIKKWEKYVEERGACMFHIITQERVDEIIKVVEKGLKSIETQLNRE